MCPRPRLATPAYSRREVGREEYGTALDSYLRSEMLRMDTATRQATGFTASEDELVA